MNRRKSSRQQSELKRDIEDDNECLQKVSLILCVCVCVLNEKTVTEINEKCIIK